MDRNRDGDGDGQSLAGNKEEKFRGIYLYFLKVYGDFFNLITFMGFDCQPLIFRSSEKTLTCHVATLLPLWFSLFYFGQLHPSVYSNVSPISL
jgi:hypothetical protein